MNRAARFGGLSKLLLHVALQVLELYNYFMVEYTLDIIIFVPFRVPKCIFAIENVVFVGRKHRCVVFFVVFFKSVHPGSPHTRCE